METLVASVQALVMLLAGLAFLGVVATLGYLYIRRVGGYRGY